MITYCYTYTCDECGTKRLGDKWVWHPNEAVSRPTITPDNWVYVLGAPARLFDPSSLSNSLQSCPKSTSLSSTRRPQSRQMISPLSMFRKRSLPPHSWHCLRNLRLVILVLYVPCFFINLSVNLYFLSAFFQKMWLRPVASIYVSFINT